MKNQIKRRFALGAAAGAIVAMGTLAACSSSPRPTPAGPTPPSSSSHPPSPIEKQIGTGPGNKFTPTVTARPAPTALPGNNQISK